MSPASNSVSITKLYKLKEDGSNWAVYRDRTSDYLKLKGLRSHLNGRVTKPIKVVKVWDDKLSKTIFYKPDDTKHKNPITLTDVLKYEELASEYDQLEGIGSDVLNNTIPASIYCEIHHLNSLSRKWKALTLMFEHRGNVVQINILTKLQAARYTSGSMRVFLSQLTKWRNDLLENDYTLSNSQFVTYITSALPSIPDYRMFISAIEGAAEVAGTTLTSEVLKKHLVAEHEARNGINSNSTTSGSTALAVNKLKGDKKKKKRNDYHCTICNMDGHSKERCFPEGEGQHDQVPEWYKKKQAKRLAKNGKNANNASTSTTTSKTSYSCAVECLPTININSIVLSAMTNDYQGIILDCGA
ncbi:hypothetical protein MD484_g8911, partial [Candolleomyces efflorescens]